MLIDALRGFALLGIVQINLQAWVVGSQPFAAVLNEGASRLDHIAWLATSFLITAKFYPIFAFLFGYGFCLQWQALSARGEDPAPVLIRRHIFLLALGVVHGSLLFFGDILTIYALAGLILEGRIRNGETVRVSADGQGLVINGLKAAAE